MAETTPTPPREDAVLPASIRQATLRDLTRDRQEVRSRGETFATCLVGAPELGKGLVVETALRQAERDGFETLLCRAEKDDALSPLSLFRDAISSWRPAGRSREGTKASSEGGAGSDSEPPSRMPLGVSSLVLEAALFPREDAPPEETPAAGEARYQHLVHSLSDPSQTALDKRSRLLTQIRTFLVERARVSPLVLALEDLQLSDRVSADLVAVLLEWRPNAPLWILVSYTTEEDLYPPLRRALERTFLSGSAVRRVIQPLSAGELRLFLLENGGRAPLPGGVLDEIVHRANGLPGVALRMARQYQTHGSLPGSVPGNTAAESPEPLANLSEEQERVLAIASVVGTTASFELLRRAAGEPEERMAELLEDLVLRGVLAERSGGSYAFHEPEQREKFYHDLTQARRRVLHRKVGEAMEGLPGKADAARVFALAHHFTQGASDEKALEYLGQALQLAREAGSLSQEAEILARTLDVHRRSHPKDHRGEATLLQQVGSVAHALGSDEEAMAALSRARDLLQNLHETGPLYAGVLLDLARVTVRQGDHGVARSLAEESLRHFLVARDDLGEAAVHRFRARLFYTAGEYGEGEAAMRACLEATRRGKGGALEIGRILTSLADMEFMADHSRREEATETLEDGIRILSGVGDKAGALFAIMGRAAVEMSLGEPQTYQTTMARVRPLVPDVPEVWRLQEAMLRKGQGHVAKGEFAEALGHAIGASDLAELIGDPERRGRALIFAVDAAGRMGEMDKATEFAKQALDLGVRTPHRRTQAEALFRLATGAHLAGDDAKAKELLTKAEEAAKGIEISRTAQFLQRELHGSLAESEG